MTRYCNTLSLKLVISCLFVAPDAAYLPNVDPSQPQDVQQIDITLNISALTMPVFDLQPQTFEGGWLTPETSLADLEDEVRDLTTERDNQLIRAQFYALLWHLQSRASHYARARLQRVEQLTQEIFPNKMATIAILEETHNVLRNEAIPSCYEETEKLREEMQDVLKKKIEAQKEVDEARRRVNQIAWRIELQEDQEKNHKCLQKYKTEDLEKYMSLGAQVEEETLDALDDLEPQEARYLYLSQQLEDSENNILLLKKEIEETKTEILENCWERANIRERNNQLKMQIAAAKKKLEQLELENINNSLTNRIISYFARKFTVYRKETGTKKPSNLDESFISRGFRYIFNKLFSFKRQHIEDEDENYCNE